MRHGNDSTIIYRLAAAFFPFLLFLSACGAGRQDPQVVLRVWDFKYGEPAMGDLMREIDRAFEARHPFVRIEHRALSDVDDDLVLAAAVAANAAPDIAMVHSGPELFALENHFLPLDGYLGNLASDVRPAALDACRGSDGTLRAFPLTSQGFGWYYNKRLFAAAGLDPHRAPETWEALLDICGRLKAAGILPIAWGNNPPHGTDWLRRGLFAAYLSREEAERLFAAGSLVEDARFRRISALIRELRDRGYLDGTGAYRDHIRGAGTLFASGGAALFYGLLSDISNWKEFSDALGPDNLGFFGTVAPADAPYPRRTAIQEAGIAYAVLYSSPNRDLAFKYIASYLEAQTAAALVERLGALVPLRTLEYPVARYPVLSSVFEAMGEGGYDMELLYPGLYIKEALFRYDELFYSTREIGQESYFEALGRALERRGAR